MEKKEVKPKTALQQLNTVRWQQQGELKRMQSLVHMTARRFYTMPSESSAKYLLDLDKEIAKVQAKYEVDKDAIQKGRRKG